MSFETPLPPYNASDPHAVFLNASCLDLLLIEIVPMAYRLTDELAARTLGDSDGAADEEEQKEAAFRRLETLGYRVGQGLVERYVVWLERSIGLPHPYSKTKIPGSELFRSADLRDLGSREIDRAFWTLWTSSNSYARTCGHWFLENRSITSRPTTEYGTFLPATDAYLFHGSQRHTSRASMS